MPKNVQNPIGSYSLGTAKPKRTWWLWPLLALLALLLIALLVWALLRGGDDEVASVAVPTATPTTSATGTPVPSLATPGQVLAGSASVLPLPASGSLAEITTAPVSANRVPVQSVPADEGFWLGDSITDRVWVAMTGVAGESGVTIKAGDLVSFTGGTLEETGTGYPAAAGVSADEGAVQLLAQRQHISVAKNGVRVND